MQQSRVADLVVIGTGMAGLSVAYEALQKGRQVVVLDRGPIAGGMTARTTAHLASAWDDRYYEFLSLRGEADTHTLYESLAASIDRIEEIARLEGIDCDFQRLDGYLFLGEGDSSDTLEKEMDACQRIGFSGVAWDLAPLPARDSGRCLKFPRQARFHPLKYLEGLTRAIIAGGGIIHPFTAVEDVTQEDASVTVKIRGGHAIQAKDVVCATNAPIIGYLSPHAKMAPYRTYVMSFAVPKDSVPDALYWDTLDAYHYVRLQPGLDHDFLIVGGEDHKTGEADDAPERFQRLHAWTIMHFGQVAEVTHRWSGQVLEPVDHLGYIGRDPDNDHIFYVTGDSGQGITNGAVAGILLSSLLESADHPWRKLYDPARVTLKAARTFLSENTTAVRSMAEHVTGPLLPSEDSLLRGQGGLVRGGLTPVAAYRDQDGVLHRVSSVCSHAGCTVHFNSFEHCWDCPCHGSHFDVDGQELNAPATRPLKPA